MRFHIYGIISAIVTSFVYPVAARWVFHPDGWLNRMGMIDFAGKWQWSSSESVRQDIRLISRPGDGPIHILGGTLGLVGTIMLGPRQGVFHDGQYTAKRSSPQNAMFGAFILYWGW